MNVEELRAWKGYRQMNIEELRKWKGSKHDDLHLLWVLTLLGLPKDLRRLILTIERKRREQETFAFQCSRIRIFNGPLTNILHLVPLDLQGKNAHAECARFLKCMGWIPSAAASRAASRWFRGGRHFGGFDWSSTSKDELLFVMN